MHGGLSCIASSSRLYRLYSSHRIKPILQLKDSLYYGLCCAKRIGGLLLRVLSGKGKRFLRKEGENRRKKARHYTGNQT